MALATLDSDQEASVVGVDTARPNLQKYVASGTVDTNFNVLPSNGLGGYGQYYGGSLYNLGLTYRTEDGADHVTPGTGEALAKAFDGAVRPTKYCGGQYFAADTFPIAVLHNAANRFSLDSLDQAFAKVEKNLLRELFFSWDPPARSDTDLLRRHTLALILHTISGFNKAGFFPPLRHIDQYVVYQPYYYGVRWINSGAPIQYDIPGALATCYGFWKQFCAHEYLTQALEYLLQAVLQAVTTTPDGMSIDEIAESLTDSTFVSALEKFFRNARTPSDALKSIGINNVPSVSSCIKARQSVGVESSQSERALFEADDHEAQQSCAIGMALLAVLYSKWRNPDDASARYIGLQAGHNLWIGNILPALDNWFTPANSWKTVIKPLLQGYILDQHDRIMYEKRRLESCWLHRVDGRVLKDQDYAPEFRSSRHWNATHILQDIGLLGINKDDGLFITTDGRQMLGRVLKSNGEIK